MAFTNNSTRKFVDISSEYTRIYNYAEPFMIVINDPLYLSISSSGHYIYAADGKMHFIPFGWKQLTWTVRDGQPNIVF